MLRASKSGNVNEMINGLLFGRMTSNKRNKDSSKENQRESEAIEQKHNFSGYEKSTNTLKTVLNLHSITHNGMEQEKRESKEKVSLQ